MRLTKKLLAAALAAATLLTAGCAGQIGADGRIGIVYLNAEGYYAGVQRGVENAFAEDDASPQLIQTNIQSDASRESTFVDTISSVAADALVLSPASATASIPAVRLAYDSGIPVICYNTCLTEEATEAYVSAYILGDPTEFGAVSGRQMAAYFQEEGLTEPKVGVINCEQFEVCIQRREGFEDALLKEVPGAEIVANQEGLTLDEAVERSEQILTAHSDLDAFYGEAGSQMLGAVRAIQARGLDGEVTVFGGDMSTQAAQMLEDNTVLKGVADISGIKVGELTAEVTRDVLAGNEPDDVIIPAPIDEYASPDEAADWLETHPDGIP